MLNPTGATIIHVLLKKSMRPVSRRVLSIFCTFASLARTQIKETMSLKPAQRRQHRPVGAVFKTAGFR